jgi:hypothetical protein
VIKYGRNTDLARPGKYPTFRDWPSSEKLFQDPPDDFRPSVYWFWSREVDRSTFRERLTEMLDAGIKSFLIQPRLGYPMEKYLSQEYFDDYRAALDIARELGMHVGIYDDYNWITGHCGGRTVAVNDKFREAQVYWVEVPVDGGKVTETPQLTGISNMLTEGHTEGLPWIYENGVCHWGEWQVLGAFTYVRTDCGIEPSSVENVTAKTTIAEAAPSMCSFQVEGNVAADASHLLILASARSTTSRMIDYLSREAVEAFVQVGYDPYYQNLRDYWDLIWCIFLDEPYTGLYHWDQMVGDLGTSLMYNEDFLREFEELHGYDILDYLYALIWPAGENTARLRCDFYQTYAERAQRVFFDRLARWAHDHGLKFTGHELMTQLNHRWAFTGKGGFDVIANFGVDHFGIGALKDVSTTDSGSFGRHISAKLASSVAHIFGQDGSMLEQYTPGFETDHPAPGARGDWNITAETVKRQMDFYAVQGLTQFLWHGYFQSNDVTEDNRALHSQRFDFPPGINYEPWFRYFPEMAIGNARLAYFLSLGRHKAPVAMLYPMRTYWSKGWDDLFAKESGFLNEYLARLHYDYDFIDERNLLMAEIEDGSLRIADESYPILVLPAVSTLQNDAVVAKLEHFAQKGGAILFSGRLPNATQEDGESKSIKERMQRLLTMSERVFYISTPLSEDPEGITTLACYLDKLGERQVSIRTAGQEDLGIFYCKREDEDSLLLALMNDECKQKELEIILPGTKGIPELWDPATGEVIPWALYRQESDGLVINLTIEPVETLCLRITQATGGLHITKVIGRLQDCDQVPGTLVAGLELFSGQAGKLALAGARSDIKALGWENGELLPLEVSGKGAEAAIAIPARELAPALKLDSEWQLLLEDGRKREVTTEMGWEKQGLEDYSGAAWYVQEINIPVETVGEPLRLEFENVCHTVEVFVNGEACGGRPWPPYIVDISDTVRPGKNRLEIMVTNTAGNEMYHNTTYDINEKAPSGIIGEVRLVPYRWIEIEIKG